MSGEYFCIEEVQHPSKFFEDYETNPPKRNASERHVADMETEDYFVKNDKGEDLRLHEIEEQLEVAENRCNTLKGQLDYMKKMYQGVVHSTDNAHGPPTRKRYMSHRKISESNSSSPNRKRPSSPRKTEKECKDQPSNDTIAYKSSSSSNLNTSCLPQMAVTAPLVRQNSFQIGTDTSGAAVNTINNILTGITDSVNRLSQLHEHIEERRSRPTSGRKRVVKDTACGNDDPGGDYCRPNKDAEVRPGTQLKHSLRNILKQKVQPAILEEIENKSSTLLPAKSKTHTKKRTKNRQRSLSKNKMHSSSGKIVSSSGSVNIKRKKLVKVTAKHVEKKTRLNPVRTAMIDEQSHSIVLAKRPKKNVKRLKLPSKTTVARKYSDYGCDKQFKQFATDNLVELYHNAAVTESDSNESNNQMQRKGESASKPCVRQRGVPEDTIPPIRIDDLMTYDIDGVYDANKPPYTSRNRPSVRSLTPIEENGYCEPAAPRTACYTTYSKNYELPTIASKLKQVAKSYLNTFNFKTIPFCAARSTSPSHNIGLNIQQVMSIMKRKTSMTGISPTLAHNIGIAAEKLHNRPLSALVSTLSSRIGYGRSICPLIRSNMNCQQLGEIAKEIPEEEYDEDVDSAGDGQNEVGGEQEIIVNGPSGDSREATTRQNMIWMKDSSSLHKTCTCVSSKGMGFSQVLEKYQTRSNSRNVLTTAKQSKHVIQKNRSMKTFGPSLRHVQKWAQGQQQALAPPQFDERSVENATVNTGKEKNLKDVLTNLHAEFEKLNTKYEETSKRAHSGGDQPNGDSLKELEIMEAELVNKEEEICMVMSLYKEVLALKKQVKVLKSKTSQGSVTMPPIQTASKFRDYKDPKAAQHLTLLLRQIQNYQMHYRRAGDNF